MSVPLESGVIKILHPNGRAAGTGFVLTPALAVTCAHVVEAAGSGPGEKLEISFYGQEFKPGGFLKTRQVSVLTSDLETDVAFLRLESLPEGVQPLELGRSANAMEGQPFTSFGFAPVVDIPERRAQGSLAGIVQAPVPGDASRMVPLLQLKADFLAPGMSGAPVLNLDSGRVVGMVCKVPGPFQAAQELAYAVPVDSLWQQWPPGEARPEQPDLAGVLRGAASGYLPGLDAFLAFYLGAPGAPAPFGGRQAQLEELDAWLQDGRSPYGLLAAPAGRGKSALLAQWAQSLLERRRGRPLFIPISLRFNIHTPELVYRALGLHLAGLHHETLPPFDRFGSAEQGLEVCRAYLERTPPPGPPAVVILDGLDELAAEPESLAVLFPARPGLKVLASARQLSGDRDEQGWVRRLEWQRRAHSFYLPLLTRSGLDEVLRAMGDPLARLAEQEALTAELFRLTQGDPLLVRLYVEALQEEGEGAALAPRDSGTAPAPREIGTAQASRDSGTATLRPEDLPSIKRGLDGYMERWWKDQQKLWRAEGLDVLAMTQAVQDFLNLLALAPAPLASEDVARIAGGKLANRLTLDQIAAAVGRLVAGDGSLEAGYAISHPRLAEYFREKMKA
jgi:hypothetical protein